MHIDIDIACSGICLEFAQVNYIVIVDASLPEIRGSGVVGLLIRNFWSSNVIIQGTC